MLNIILIVAGVIAMLDLVVILALCRVANRADRRLVEQDPQLLGNPIPVRGGTYCDHPVMWGSEAEVRSAR